MLDPIVPIVYNNLNDPHSKVIHWTNNYQNIFNFCLNCVDSWWRYLWDVFALCSGYHYLA
jgi:hypothetical protein